MPFRRSRLASGPRVLTACRRVPPLPVPGLMTRCWFACEFSLAVVHTLSVTAQFTRRDTRTCYTR